MLKKILFLKICFLAGAVADGLALLPMLFPSIRETVFGTSGPAFGPEYRYAMGIGSALMAGWTILLVWGYFKPVERRDLLLITAFPVIPCLMTANIYGVMTGIVEVAKMIPVWGIEIMIMLIYFAGYKISRKMAHSG